MKLHLNYHPPKPDFEINHAHKLLLTGSCFAENIGGYIQEHKFTAEVNPAGILFNPLSIYNNLMDCITEKQFDSKYLVEKGGVYFSFLHHSSVKESSSDKLIEKINQINNDALRFIKNADFLILTFGTAFYYWHILLNICVSNCHKQPGNVFEKKILSINEIVEKYNLLINQLNKINPKLKIIFTVSPVKYLKDGVENNSLSKATLLLSINEIVTKNKNTYYFPAYELVNDDLRDYRFYKSDMTHPNLQAIDYVWQKFSETYFSNKTKTLNQKINQLIASQKHKPMHNNIPENEKFQKHIEELNKEINDLIKR